MDRLDAIVSAVKSKDVTIEESLDLLEEGIELGIRATDLVEKPDFTRREQEALERGDAEATDGAASEDGASDATPSDSVAAEVESAGAAETAESPKA